MISHDSNELQQATTPRVCFLTLGCKVNQTESEALAQLFHNNGYRVVSSLEEAEVVVINTCTVTNTGDAKSRQVIRRMIKTHPQAFVVVMGCYAQTAPGEVLDIEGVDLVLGTQDRGKVLDLIEQVRAEQKPQSKVHSIWEASTFEELPLMEGESRTRATLKIQEGCNKFCTYCIIPYARGPVRSRKHENALAEAQKLVDAGYQEIVLTGIHTGSYGEDAGEDWNLAHLVKALTEIPGLTRLRLSSIEPMEFTPELIEVILSSPAVCHHLHIPLQSGSDTILARMKRPYTTREFKELVDEFNEKIPGIAITTDVIVGFPGETEQDFRDSMEFIQTCHFAGIHVFPYSKRKGTPAAQYPDHLTKKVKEQRVKALMAVAQQSHDAYVQQCLGTRQEVLIEQVAEDGSATGHTRTYIQVQLPARQDGKAWESGDLVEFVLEAQHIRK